MKKISRIEAVQLLNEEELKMYDEAMISWANFDNKEELEVNFYIVDESLMYLILEDKKTSAVVESVVFELEVKKVGRPSLGVTKKVSVTLPVEVWQEIDQLKEEGQAKSYSEFFRILALKYSEGSEQSFEGGSE